MAGNQRTTPDIIGVLTRVSADLTRDPPATPPSRRQAYYRCASRCRRRRWRGSSDMRLVPGMPAEAFIQTHERTPLQYLLKPLREQIARTFRER